MRKAVELGVAEIQPVLAAASVARPKGERAAARQAHWQKIAISACEQCGRNRIPAVPPMRGLPPTTAARPARASCCRRASELRFSQAVKARREFAIAAGPGSRLRREGRGGVPRRRLRAGAPRARACCAPRPRRSPRSPRSTRCGETSRDQLGEARVAVVARDVERRAAAPGAPVQVDALAGDVELDGELIVALYRVEELRYGRSSCSPMAVRSLRACRLRCTGQRIGGRRPDSSARGAAMSRPSRRRGRDIPPASRRSLPRSRLGDRLVRLRVAPGEHVGHGLVADIGLAADAHEQSAVA